MFDKAVDSYLLILKLIPDWFVTSKMIEKLDHALYSNVDIVFGDVDSDIVTFFSNDIVLNSINLKNNINLDEDNFDNCDPDILIMFDLWLAIINISNIKHL